MTPDPIGRKGMFAMIETVTAVMGLVSAGIFLAHAFEHYRTRGAHHPVQTELARKSLMNSGEHRDWQVLRNHDLVSGGFLAVTAACLVLLCSSLLAFAFV
jgi:hypothetical protein